MSEHALSLSEIEEASMHASAKDFLTDDSIKLRPVPQRRWQSSGLFEVPEFSAEDVAEARQLCRAADTYMNIDAISEQELLLHEESERRSEVERARIKRRGASAIISLKGAAVKRAEIERTPTVQSMPAVQPKKKKPAWAVSETMWFMAGSVPVGMAQLESEPQDYNALQDLNERYTKRAEIPETVRRQYTLDSE